MPQSVDPLISELARKYRIDPRAAIAVAQGEGGLVNRQGDIGDLAGGGSYGPFQLYAKGALPAQYRGKPRQADAWAWSPQGIEYALRKMSEAGASGLTGPKAVEAIIRRFERPADPDTSVRNALARLGSGGGTGAPTPAAAPAAPAAPAQSAEDPRRALLLSLVQQRRSGNPDRAPIIAALQNLQRTQDAPAAPAQAAPTARQPTAAAAEPPPAGATLDSLLSQLGLGDAVTSGDRPGAITARGGRSDHSRPGKARDINYRDPAFPQLVAYAQANPGAFKDFIYSGLPWFIDEGRRYPIRQLNKTDRGNHRDHAHISYR